MVPWYDTNWILSPGQEIARWNGRAAAGTRSVGRESPTAFYRWIRRRILNVGISLIGGEKWTDGGF